MAISPGMKMMIAQKTAKRERSEYAAADGRRMIGFDREENRSRMRGGERNGMGNNSPRGEYNEYSEMRGGDYNRMNGGDYGRMNADNYRPRNEYPSNTYPGTMEMRMPSYQSPPDMRMPPFYPILPDMRAGGNAYNDIYAHGTIYAPNAMNKPYGDFSARESSMEEPVTEHKAREWVRKMTSGERFKPEVTEQHKMSVCPECDKWEFYAAMNAMYSDYCKTAQKMGVDKPDFYAHMAKDFLMDEDAKPGKLAKYMKEIAK